MFRAGGSVTDVSVGGVGHDSGVQEGHAYLRSSTRLYSTATTVT